MVVSFIMVKTGLGIYKEEKDKSFFSQSEFSWLFSFLLLIVGFTIGGVGGYFFFTCLFNMLAARGCGNLLHRLSSGVAYD